MHKGIYRISLLLVAPQRRRTLRRPHVRDACVGVVDGSDVSFNSSPVAQQQFHHITRVLKSQIDERDCRWCMNGLPAEGHPSLPIRPLTHRFASSPRYVTSWSGLLATATPGMKSASARRASTVIWSQLKHICRAAGRLCFPRSHSCRWLGVACRGRQRRRRRRRAGRAQNTYARRERSRAAESLHCAQVWGQLRCSVGPAYRMSTETSPWTSCLQRDQ